MSLGSFLLAGILMGSLMKESAGECYSLKRFYPCISFPVATSYSRRQKKKLLLSI